MISLLDDWSVDGTDYLEFADMLREMDACTRDIKLDGANINVMSYVGEDDYCFFFAIHTGIEPTFDADEGSFKSYSSPKIARLIKHRFHDKGVDLDKFREELLRHKTLLRIEYVPKSGEKTVTVVFFGAGVMSTLGPRLNLGGRSIQVPSYGRNEYLQTLLNKREGQMTLMIRTLNAVHKVYAAHSGSYPRVQQIVLHNIAKNFMNDTSSMGKSKCVRWHIDHQFSEVYIEFPEKAEEFKTFYGLPEDIVPGIILSTSDTGENSVMCKGTFRLRNGIVIQKVFKKEHRGTVNEESILKSIEEAIFSKYRVIPERLCELLTKEVVDVPTAIDSAFNELGISSFGGKKTQTALIGALISEIPASGVTTAYDVCTSIMSIQGRLEGFPEYTKKAIENNCAKAPFLNWDKICADSTLPSTGVYLTA